ncbi:phosphotransferase [Brevibacillus sp. DP1.3A]|uniref:phosphotransferase n=1 Tax=Brevibacillus sp. DP1.3A TaxID=2738867 RepID=UPI00156ACC07|nr:phosphotransferase [Brevibacillus sp. DP1.3A]UED76978.1 phosphotransferase [Brevibacillus sp. DP1.3A]
MTNSNPWDADWEVSEPLARELIFRQFPQLSTMPIKLIGCGWDNMAFRVGDEYVFRFPRRNVAVELIKKEGVLLPMLAAFLTIPYPKPVFYGEPNDDYPFAFLGYTYVSGTFPKGLTDEQRASSAVALATFLKSLHTFPPQLARENGIEHDHRNLLDIAQRKEKMQTFLSTLAVHISEEDRDAIANYLGQIVIDRISPREVLLHGDLHVKNMLINEVGHISGIIDWGDLNVGHPGADLNVAYSFLPPQARQSFFHAYGEVDEETKILARIMAVYIPMLLWMQALDHNDKEVAEEARMTIRRALADE